jgi:hypothetical protein
LTAQERKSFATNNNNRGNRRPVRNQKPRTQVTIIADDENPEGMLMILFCLNFLIFFYFVCTVVMSYFIYLSSSFGV